METQEDLICNLELHPCCPLHLNLPTRRRNCAAQALPCLGDRLVEVGEARPKGLETEPRKPVGAVALARRRGEWSEHDVHAAIRRKDGNNASQQMLQKNLSMLTSVGPPLSLFHVNLLFLHLISRSPAASMAALNIPIIRLLSLWLFFL